jgi:hypothetical protein
MKIINRSKIILILLMAISPHAFCVVMIDSPLGTKLIFSEKQSGKYSEPYSWKKLTFKGYGETIDLSINERYFTEDGASKVSPSGRYIVINSVSGGYLYSEKDERKYVDRAYCSVVDMRNGCYVSDWDGEACGFNWKKNQDVLENSIGTESFDFLSLRPKIKNIKDNPSSLKVNTVRNFLRCDAPDRGNINIYQRIMQENKPSKLITSQYILKFLSDINLEKTIKIKSYLFSSPENQHLTKAYLVPGDKVKVIQFSPDSKWVNIGYIGEKGNPLIVWVMADSLGN